jgi:hypothetical protein
MEKFRWWLVTALMFLTGVLLLLYCLPVSHKEILLVPSGLVMIGWILNTVLLLYGTKRK